MQPTRLDSYTYYNPSNPTANTIQGHGSDDLLTTHIAMQAARNPPSDLKMTRADIERRILYLNQKPTITEEETQELGILTRELHKRQQHVKRIFTTTTDTPPSRDRTPSPPLRIEAVRDRMLSSQHHHPAQSQSSLENPHQRASTPNASLDSDREQQSGRKFKKMKEPYHYNAPFSPHWGDTF